MKMLLDEELEDELVPSSQAWRRVLRLVPRTFTRSLPRLTLNADATWSFVLSIVQQRSASVQLLWLESNLILAMSA